MRLHQWHLPTGVMYLSTDADSPDADTADAASYQVADLLDVGSRQNPRRPFVFVSTVLGKHMPCAPSRMRSAQRALAAELGPEPALFIGMAETATGMGEGVYSAWHEQSGGSPGLYIATTRYVIDGCEVLDFTEAHSHATQLKLYLPTSASGRRRLAGLRRVVLVDDEISTGKTFASLVRALREQIPQLSTIDVVALTDFSGGQVIERLREVPGVERVRVHALLSGTFEFRSDARTVTSASPAQRAVGCRRSRMMAGTSRAGITRPLQLSESVVQAAMELAGQRPVRLIATGEFMYPAQYLGEQLEARGFEVALQSTTRSPLMVGGAITASRVVTDPYGEGIDNYIYNLADDDEGEARIIVHETGDNAQIRRLCTQLQAIALDIDTVQRVYPDGGRAVA